MKKKVKGILIAFALTFALGLAVTNAGISLCVDPPFGLINLR